jgi:hypothetical protein
MPQYVRVVFPGSRQVEVDDTLCGVTNDVLIVQEGTHRFDLGDPVNYSPAFDQRVVSGTTPGNPLVITFMPVETADTARIPLKGNKE